MWVKNLVFHLVVLGICWLIFQLPQGLIAFYAVPLLVIYGILQRVLFKCPTCGEWALRHPYTRRVDLSPGKECRSCGNSY